MTIKKKILLVEDEKQAGADSFMTKPFRPEELWQEIKRFL